MKHFTLSAIILFFGLIIAYYLGGLAGVYIASLLALLEVSLSFDNAVVNAKYSKRCTPYGKKDL